MIFSPVLWLVATRRCRLDVCGGPHARRRSSAPFHRRGPHVPVHDVTQAPIGWSGAREPIPGAVHNLTLGRGEAATNWVR